MDSKGIGYEEEVRKAISQLREEMIGIYDQMKSYQSLLQAVHKKLEVEVLDSGDGARSEDARNAHDQFHSNVVELKREFAKVIEPNGRYDRTFKTFDLIRRVLLDPQIKETGLEVQDLKNLVVLLLRYKELMKDTLDATVGRDTPFGEGDNWDCDGTHEDTLNLRLKEWNKNYGKSSYKRNKYSSYELSKDFRTFYFEASARMAIETLAWKDPECPNDLPPKRVDLTPYYPDLEDNEICYNFEGRFGCLFESEDVPMPTVAEMSVVEGSDTYA